MVNISFLDSDRKTANDQSINLVMSLTLIEGICIIRENLASPFVYQGSHFKHINIRLKQLLDQAYGSKNKLYWSYAGDNNYEKFIFFSSIFREIKNNQILEGLTSFGELIQPSGKCCSIEKGMYTQNISDPKLYDKKHLLGIQLKLRDYFGFEVNLALPKD